MTNGPIKRGKSHKIIDNAETRVGNAKVARAHYGRDSIGLKMSMKDRETLLRSGAKDLVAGMKKAKKNQ